jgi:hypothetical protein
MLELNPPPHEGDLLKTLHPKENKTSAISHDPPVSHYLRKVKGSLRIIVSGDFLGTFPPTSFIYLQSVNGCGFQLSCWGPPLQGHFSTINPVLAISCLPILCHSFILACMNCYLKLLDTSQHHREEDLRKLKIEWEEKYKTQDCDKASSGAPYNCHSTQLPLWCLF